MSNSYAPLRAKSFRLLNRSELEKIEAGAYEILERVGMKLTDPESKEALAGAGAEIDGDRVYLPEELVRESIESAPGSLEIFDQAGGQALSLAGRKSYFGASIDGPNILDTREGTYRDCREDDIGRIVRLADKLENISFLMPAGFAADHPSRMAEIVATKQVLLNTDKPFVAITEGLDDLKAVHEMAETKAEDSFREKPFFVNYAEPISPLVNPDSSVRKVRYCAKEEIPLLYSPFLAMGATAPQDPPTAVAQAAAESLFGLVLQQGINPGAPFVLGGMPSLMDMETANFSYGAPDLHVMSSAITELGHQLGLPVFGTGGTGDSRLFDSQAVLEALSSSYMAALSGTNLIHDVGLFGSAKILIPEMIVVMDEIIDLLRNTITGLRAEDELAVDLLKEVGPGGEFVSHSHTMENFKESWYPRFVDRNPFNKGEAGEISPFCDRIEAYLSEFIEKDEGESAAANEEIARNLGRIQDKYAARKK
ncbi:trimethylamine methyltransferase family protein [Candidatus Bipolaricaulota bacterium]|nr:trimethylamine methyltransferase family protein [Candidatus Bipolaricaulota bacterium]